MRSGTRRETQVSSLSPPSVSSATWLADVVNSLVVSVAPTCGPVTALLQVWPRVQKHSFLGRGDKGRTSLARSGLPPGWVASRVITLPPAKGMLAAGTTASRQPHQQTPQTHQQPRPSRKLSKADKPQDTPLDTLPPWALAVCWRKA